jgi:cell cycle checkpoint control protein RAD9A
LKQPLHTSVTLDSKDFDEYMVKDGLHVAISAKDFKAVVIHADSLKTPITARYTRPCRPMQLAYKAEGIGAEFTLMTRGEVDDNDDNQPASSSRPASQLSARPAAQRVPASGRPSMPPPPTPSARSSASRPLPPPPSRSEIISTDASRSAFADLNDSLFVPADDDRQWDEQDYEEEQEDILTWNSKVEAVCSYFSRVALLVLIAGLFRVHIMKAVHDH